MSIFQKSPGEVLISDISSVVESAEAILTATADQTGSEIAKLRGTMVSRLAGARTQLLAIERAFADNARQTAKGADEFLHTNPWQSTLVAGGVGLLLGYLISFRRS